MMPNVSEVATALIRVFEGCRLTAYEDSGGVLTIGYGETGPHVLAGMTITQEIADAWLISRIAPLVSQVAAHEPVSKSVEAQSALVSFGYNCGAGALDLVLGGHDLISNPRHCTDRHGNILPGLQARRNLEELLSAL
jgi:GH24 family phage-related lysozyme (muramidase)